MINPKVIELYGEDCRELFNKIVDGLCPDHAEKVYIIRKSSLACIDNIMFPNIMEVERGCDFVWNRINEIVRRYCDIDIWPITILDREPDEKDLPLCVPTVEHDGTMIDNLLKEYENKDNLNKRISELSYLCNTSDERKRELVILESSKLLRSKSTGVTIDKYGYMCINYNSLYCFFSGNLSLIKRVKDLVRLRNKIYEDNNLSDIEEFTCDLIVFYGQSSIS